MKRYSRMMKKFSKKRGFSAHRFRFTVGFMSSVKTMAFSTYSCWKAKPVV
jgi:hypothetical protein